MSSKYAGRGQENSMYSPVEGWTKPSTPRMQQLPPRRQESVFSVRKADRLPADDGYRPYAPGSDASFRFPVPPRSAYSRQNVLPPVMGHRPFRVDPSHGSAQPVFRISADRRTHRTAVRFKIAADQRLIPPRDRVLGQLRRQALVCRVIFGNHQKTTVSLSIRCTIPGRMTPFIEESLSRSENITALTSVPV